VSLLIGFAPFAVFALLDRTVGGATPYLVAAALAAVFLVRDVASRGKVVKLLDVGTVALFGGLGLYKLATGVAWSALDAGLRVDLGLFAIVAGSLAVRRPFTLQYAKEQTPPEVWTRPAFMRINNAITAVWAASFGVAVLSDLAMMYAGEPRALDTVISLAALGGALLYTKRASRPRGVATRP
jgi:hypothetical protein